METKQKLKKLDEAVEGLEQVIQYREWKNKSFLHRFLGFLPTSRKSVKELDTSMIKLTIGLIHANKEILCVLEYLQENVDSKPLNDTNPEGYA